MKMWCLPHGTNTAYSGKRTNNIGKILLSDKKVATITPVASTLHRGYGPTLPGRILTMTTKIMPESIPVLTLGLDRDPPEADWQPVTDYRQLIARLASLKNSGVVAVMTADALGGHSDLSATLGALPGDVVICAGVGPDSLHPDAQQCSLLPAASLPQSLPPAVDMARRLAREKQELWFRQQFFRVARRRADNFIGSGDHTRRLLDQALLYSRQRDTILITGESGTGKDLLARTLHRAGPRHDKPFIIADATTLPADLMESELFGHRRGAFTGAVDKRIGLIKAAEGGILFLDEIGELPAGLQAKLLRFLENGTYRPVGDTTEITANVQVIAATNRGLEQEVTAGRFRADLFYRLNILRLHIQPLRERLDEIPELCDHFRRLYNEELGTRVPGFTPAAVRTLQQHPWPGNVRELSTVIKRSILVAGSDNRLDAPDVRGFIDPHRTPAPETGDAAPHFNMNDFDTFREAKHAIIADFEQRWLQGVLTASGGNVSEAARRSGMDRKSFYELMKRNNQPS